MRARSHICDCKFLLEILLYIIHNYAYDMRAKRAKSQTTRLAPRYLSGAAHTVRRIQPGSKGQDNDSKYGKYNIHVRIMTSKSTKVQNPRQNS